MSDTAIPQIRPTAPRRFRLLVALLTVLCGAGGFALGYFGLWSPVETAQGMIGRAEHGVPTVPVYVALPQLEIAVAGSGGKHLIFSAMIETQPAAEGRISPLMPRILDDVTGFLSAVDHRAYDKRGVLEIIRAELITRIAADLGDIPFNGLLITEFRFR